MKFLNMEFLAALIVSSFLDDESIYFIYSVRVCGDSPSVQIETFVASCSHHIFAARNKRYNASEYSWLPYYPSWPCITPPGPIWLPVSPHLASISPILAPSWQLLPFLAPNYPSWSQYYPSLPQYYSSLPKYHSSWSPPAPLFFRAPYHISESWPQNHPSWPHAAPSITPTGRSLMLPFPHISAPLAAAWVCVHVSVPLVIHWSEFWALTSLHCSSRA